MQNAVSEDAGGPDAMAHLRAFAALLRAGETRQALHAASEACHAAPHLPQPHYAYGQAWLALDEPARAEQAFAAAIRCAPGWADPWVNYGVARYRQGALGDATQAMRMALRCDPGHAAAAANLGAFLRLTGQTEAAETLLRGSLTRNPGHAATRLNLVADLLAEERAAEAWALLEQAAPPDEDPALRRHWLLAQALALLQLRRPAEARAVLESLAAQAPILGPMPAAVAPLWHWRHVLLALAEGDPAAARLAAQRMAQALGAGGAAMLPEHRIMAHYDLAKFWSAQGGDAAAFAHWQAGHDLLRPLQPFSRAAHRAVIEANIAAFPRARFARARCAANRDPCPVFIVGMPRSGTTLCEQIIAAHGQAHGAGERAALGAAFARLGGGSDAAAVARVAALDGPVLDGAAAEYLAALHALAPDRRRIVDKLPGNYLYLGLVGMLLPAARIIHCVRDSRDIGLSIFTFRFYGQHGYAHDLGDLGWTIAQQERLMAHWKAVLGRRILTVRLADWVEDFDTTLARVLAHLGLPPDPACARFYEQQSRVRTVSRSQVRQTVNARGLGRWRRYAAQLAPLIAELEAAGALAAWADPAAARAAPSGVVPSGVVSAGVVSAGVVSAGAASAAPAAAEAAPAGGASVDPAPAGVAPAVPAPAMPGSAVPGPAAPPAARGRKRRAGRGRR